MNPKLEKLYQLRETDLTKEDKERIVEKESPVAGKVKIHCKRCKRTFLADHYNQQYCDDCKRYLNRERWRENKDKERKRKIEERL